MWNPNAPFITLVLSMAFALALFVAKRIAVLLRWDDKKDQLKVHLKDDFPIFFWTIIVAVVVFFCCYKSSYEHFISNGLVFVIWFFLFFILHYVLLWPLPRYGKTPEELKEEYGEKFCPYCNNPLTIEKYTYICKSKGCKYKYYVEDLPEYKPEEENRLKVYCMMFVWSLLANFTFYFAAVLVKMLIKFFRSY